MTEDLGKPRKKRVCPRCREEIMVSAYSRQKSESDERARGKTTSWYPVGWYCPSCQHFVSRPRPKIAQTENRPAEPEQNDQGQEEPVQVETLHVETLQVDNLQVENMQVENGQTAPEKHRPEQGEDSPDTAAD